MLLMFMAVDALPALASFHSCFHMAPRFRPRSPKAGRPDVDITYCGRSAYWMVDIKCKDRPKLLFDTVCTLADCGYDVFHATIDSHEGSAHQEVRA